MSEPRRGGRPNRKKGSPGGRGPSIARAVAARVLQRVAAQGAWAAPTLDAELSRARADARDAALATEIVYGSLRTLPRLDAALEAHLRDPGGLDPYTRAALRAAAYQLLYLSRAPSHAVVHDAVSLVQRERGPGLSRVVNAVLRKVAKARPEAPERPGAVVLPAWAEGALVEALGEARAAAFAEARPLPPPITLRAWGGREALAERLREGLAGRAGRADRADRAEVSLGGLSPLALHLRGAGDPRGLPSFEEGAFAVQDEGAQLVALALGARPGEKVADLCSGRGGKSALLAWQVGPEGEVLAVDLDEDKLDRIPKELRRLGLDPAIVEGRALDLSVGTGDLERRFDRVLVDAPCSGLGTVHRRPELLLRLGPEDPARMAALQLRVLTSAAKLVRPGGELAYAVCSFTDAEGPGVATQFEASTPGATRLLEPAEGLREAGGALAEALTPDPDGVARIGPWSDPEHGAPDAYQIVRWRIIENR